MGFPFGPFVQTLVVTAQRRDEVAGMGRRELKDAGALWTIPAPRTKKGLEHDVPLSAAAKEVLTEIPRIGRSDLVFTTAGVTSMSGYSKAKARLDALSGASGSACTNGTSRSRSSFFGVFTHVETGHMVMSSAGNGLSRSLTSGSGPTHRS
jgi:integrase